MVSIYALGFYLLVFYLFNFIFSVRFQLCQLTLISANFECGFVPIFIVSYRFSSYFWFIILFFILFEQEFIILFIYLYAARTILSFFLLLCFMGLLFLDFYLFLLMVTMIDYERSDIFNIHFISI